MVTDTVSIWYKIFWGTFPKQKALGKYKYKFFALIPAVNTCIWDQALIPRNI